MNSNLCRLLVSGVLLVATQIIGAQQAPKMNPFTGGPLIATPAEKLSLPLATHVFFHELRGGENLFPGTAVQRLKSTGLSEAASIRVWNYALSALKADAEYQYSRTMEMCARNTPTLTKTDLVAELVRFSADTELEQEKLGSGVLSVLSAEEKARLDSWVEFSREKQWRVSKRPGFEKVVSESTVEPTAFLRRHCSVVTAAR
jgi:hypothetical protein